MGMARTVESLLQAHGVSYALMHHPPQYRVFGRGATTTHWIRPEQLARAVVLSDGQKLIMAVVPSHLELRLHALSAMLGRALELASEAQTAPVFRDCARGVIPPVGPAYGIETIMDESLVEQERIYFVDGEHDELVCVDGDEFRKLLGEVHCGRICH